MNQLQRGWLLGGERAAEAFQGWQTAALNLHKRHWHGLRDWLEPKLLWPEGLLSGERAAEAFQGWQEGVLSGERAAEAFQGWQTAALNLHKKTLARPQGVVGSKSCCGLRASWAVNQLQLQLAPGR